MKLLEAAGPSCPNCGSSDIKVLDSGADPYKDGGGGEGSTNHATCECNNCGTTYTFITTSYYTDIEVGAGLDDTIYGIFTVGFDYLGLEDNILPLTAKDLTRIDELVGKPDKISENIVKNLYKVHTFNELAEALSKIKVTADHYYNEVDITVNGATLPTGGYVSNPALGFDNLTDKERIEALKYLKSPKAAKAYFKTEAEGKQFLDLYTDFVKVNENYSSDGFFIPTDQLKVLPFTLNELYDKVMREYGYK